jgi:biopolymer transport protein ExbD
VGSVSPTNSKSPGIFDVNMTPLIDVSLVLVVILLVATPLAFQSGIGVRNAAAAGRKSEEKAKTERVEISILSSDSLTVNRSAVNRDALPAVLGPLLAASATRQVVVRCADDVPHGAFVGILDEAKAAGALQIAIVGG